MGRVVGIDLGTTNTAVAVLVDGKPKVLEDERGYKVLPSCVSAKGDGRFIVGHAAHNLIITRPGRTVYATKRLIGRRFDSPEATEAKTRMQYQIREAPDGLVQAQVGDAWMSPTEIAAIILQVVKSIAERGLGDSVDSAVITVPAYFNHQQRQATLDAAQLAGLRCERLLNEPTAAALAYGFKKTAEKTILVFDLGGGTFDVSVLRIGGGLYETLSTVGDTYLGGEDFDFRLVDFLADSFKQKHGIDLRNDKHTLQRLKDAAERAKCELSFSERTAINVPHVTPTANLEVTVTRAQLEQITADLVARCVEVTRKAVAEAGIELRAVEEVVLVGGQSRMPRLREAVTGLFGKEPSRSVHPEEAVAVGAAIYAAGLDDPEQPGAVLLDVTPFDLGIDSAGGMFTPVIERNSRVPGQQGRSFVTARDGQDVVKIVVRQGNSRVASENEFLGEFLMTGLTRAPRFQTKVEVTFRLDSNGILHVAAVEKGTGEKKQIIIRNYAQRATDAKMPTPEEAAADRERRAREEVGTETIAPVPVSAGTKKKAGFFGSLFGTKSKTPKAAKATPDKKGTPEEKAAPVAPPLQEAPAAIDLSAVAMSAPIQMPAPPTGEMEAPPPPPPSSRPAAIGLAGEGSAVDPFATPVEAEAIEGFADDLQELSGLDADDLFGGLGDDGDNNEPIQGEEPSDGGFGFLEEPETASGGFGDLDARFQAGGNAAPQAEPPAPAPSKAKSPAKSAFSSFSEEDVDLDALAEGLAKELADSGDWEDAAMFGSDAEPAPEPPVDDEQFFLPPPASTTSKPKDPLDYPDQDEITPDAPLSRGGTRTHQAPPPASEPEGSLEFLDLAPKAAEPAKKPARIKLSYRRYEVFVNEYRENLRRGGTFIKTDKPLTVGRSCIFEIRVPGVNEPLTFDAVVSWVQDASTGESGMGVEYRLDDRQRQSIERLLRLGGG